MCSKTGIQYSNLSSPQMDVIWFNQILNGDFVELDKLIFKIYKEEGKPRKAKACLEKNQERFLLPDTKPYDKAVVIRKWDISTGMD